MKTIVLCGVLSALAILLVPSAPGADRPETQENLVLWIDQTGAGEGAQPAAGAGEYTGRSVLLRTSGGLQTLPEQTYLAAVVLAEMPAAFESEALRAQAVAARTFLRRQQQSGKHPDCDLCADSACCQAWLSETELEEKYGEALCTTWEKASDAVLATTDEVLTWQGALIDATYFSCSGGSTEAAVAVWGTDVPYLQAVESPGEQEALRYESEVCFSADELRGILLAAAPEADLSGPAEEWFGETGYTDGGGVETICIGGAVFDGTQLRRLLGLNSTKFTVRCRDGSITFHVLGYGHRVGMSQYGANAMAKLGFDYRTILQYYYRGVKIENLPQTEI